jgi:hypothetical protein
VLTDFGVARFFTPPGSLDGTHSPSITADGALLGTPPYLSPEQILGRDLDGRSDIFSLGCVLYEACTGRLAFPAPQLSRLLDDILHNEPEPIGHHNYAVPAELERIIRKTLRKSPEERYQSARELAVDLRALRGPTAETPAPAHERAWTLRLSPRGLRRGALGLGLLLAVGAPGWWALERMVRDRLPDCTPQQLTTAEGWEAEPALAPAGDFLAYSSNESGNPDIWLIHLRTGRHLRLTTHAGDDRAPAWFPSGNELVYVSRREGVDGLWTVPLFGGEPTPLVAPARDPAVSPDGTRLAYAAPDSAGNLRIWVAPLADLSKARRLTHDDDGLWWHRRPSWSPDGRTICYGSAGPVGRARRGGARVTTRGFAGRAAHRARFAGISFSSYWRGVQALWRVQSDGGGVERLTSNSSTEDHPTISATAPNWPTHVRREPDVVRATGRATPVAVAGLREETEPDAAPGRQGSGLRVGPVGRAVRPLAAAARGRATVGEPRRLTSHPALPAFSGGRWVAYRIYRNRPPTPRTRAAIWMVPAGGSRGRPSRSQPECNPRSPRRPPPACVAASGGRRTSGSCRWARERATGSATRLPHWRRRRCRLVAGGRAIAFVGLAGTDSGVARAGRQRRWARRVTTGAGAQRAEPDTGRLRRLLRVDRNRRGRPQIRHRLRPRTPADFDVAAGGCWWPVHSICRGDLWILKAQRGALVARCSFLSRPTRRRRQEFEDGGKLAVKDTAATKSAAVTKPGAIRRITLADVSIRLHELEYALARVREVLDEFAEENPGVAMDCKPPLRRITPAKPEPPAPFCRNCGSIRF